MLAAYLVIFFGTVAIATSRRCMTTGIVVIDRTYGNYMSNETFFKMTDKIRLNTGGKDDDSFECDEFDAVDQDRTSRCLQMCKCTKEASTFSQFDGEWTCVENEEFREREDCGFLFAMERKNDPLRILQDGEEKAVFLPSGNCSIDASTSEYLDCGIWRSIDNMSVLNKFSLHGRFTDSFSFKVGGSNFSTFLNGRVIKLGLTCLPPVGKPCLLFKLRGSERCSLYGTHFTPAQAAHTSTFKPSETRDDFLPVESYLITPTRSVSSTSTISTSAEERLSIEARQTMPLYTAPTLEGVAPLSVKGMSLITSFGKTLLTPKPTAHIIIFSSSIFVDERFDSRRMTSNSKTETMTKIVASKSIFDAKGSIGMNSTPILPNVRRRESTPRSRGRTSNSIIVTAVIPGSLAGLLVILVSILLLFLARRMGHLVRVAAERDVDAGDEGQQSISEDHTIRGSEENCSVENLSVYELAERGNSSSVTENQASVTSPV